MMVACDVVPQRHRFVNRAGSAAPELAGVEEESVDVLQYHNGAPGHSKDR